MLYPFQFHNVLLQVFKLETPMSVGDMHAVLERLRRKHLKDGTLLVDNAPVSTSENTTTGVSGSEAAVTTEGA